MGLFVDLIESGVASTNAALELLCKAHGDDDLSIWDEHPNPLLRRIVELFTQRGLDRFEGVRRELVDWLNGHRFEPGDLRPRPAGLMQRWTDAEVGLVGLYLRSLPPEDWSLEDHMLLVDWITQRYLPPDEMRTEAEWLAMRSTMMGRVQANMAAEATGAQADTLLQALPATLTQVRDAFGMTPRFRAVMEFSTARSAEHVSRVTDDVRHRMRGIVAQRAERIALGDTTGPSLETELGDAFGALNRDWRRIAVTEATEAQAQGFIAMQAPRSRVRRVEQYRNACSWCRSIDGKVFKVVDPAEPDKDGETEVWVGKTNVGRAAAPRKRVGGLLIDREAGERWWPAAGAQHPHCRGRWLLEPDETPGQDPEFSAWMWAKLKATAKRPAEE